MKFDINAARSAGYSDDEIADYLATENKFDLSGALKSGYSPSEVIDFLSAPKGGKQDLPSEIKPSEGRSATPMGQADPRLVKQEPASRTMSDVALDTGITLLKGAIGLPESVVGLLDIPTQGRIGKFLEEKGYRPREAKEILDTYLSEAQQAANKKVQQADGFAPTVQAALENPSTIATSIGESLPQMVGGAGVARGLMKAAPKVTPWVAGAVGEGVLGAGSAAEQMRGQTQDGLLTGKQAAAAVGSGVGTAIFGAVGGRVANKLGFDDIETMLASGASKGPAKSVGDFAKRVAASGLSEGAFEEMPQSAQEQMWQNYATDKPLLDGVGNAAGMGLVTGAAMGAAGGGAGAIMRPATREAEIARALDQGVASTEFSVPASEVAVDRLNPNSYDSRMASPAETAKPGEVVNFTEPDSATAQAGLTPIVVPMPSTEPAVELPTVNPSTEQEFGLDKLRMRKTDVSTASAAAAQPAVGGVAGGDQLGRGVDLPGSAVAGATEQLGGRAGQPAADAQQAVATGDRAGQQPASLNPQPTEQWFGRKGDGYATEADASQAMAGRQRMFPDLDWQVEQMPSGKFRLVGYSKPEAAQAVVGDKINKDWTAFSPESDSLGIPRADMPQVKGEHRGAMINFLNARGITNEQDSVDPSTLKPTQAEFSPAKVETAKENRGNDRAILVSSDGRVIDGHHQWMAKLEKGEPVSVIRLNAPAQELIAAIKEFPSSTTANGATLGTQTTQALQAEAQGQEAATAASATAAPGAAPAAPKLQDSGVQGLKFAPAASLKDFKIFQQAVAADGIEIAPVRMSEMNDQHKVASLIARQLGKTYTVARVTSGDPMALSNGMIDKLGGKHIVAAENAEDAPLFVAIHEAYHGLPEADRRALNAQLLPLFKTENKAKFLSDFKYSEAEFEEEAPAFMAQVISKRADFWDELRTKMGDGEFAQVAKLVLDSLNQILRKVSGAYGEDFANTYISDVVKARNLLTDAYAKAVQSQGQQTSSEASDVVRSNRVTETPAFKRWFGDSKVVDSEGRPLVVYHGTKADIKAFDPTKIGSNFKFVKAGYFFSSDPSIASDFAAEYGGEFENANVIPAYVSIQNPLTLDAALDATGVEMQEDESLLEFYDWNQPEILQAAKAGGHDGVIFDQGDDKLVVAFRPEQIKSATGNQGTFDPENPDIRKSNRADINAKLQERIDADFDGAAQEYAALKGTRGGRVLDTDQARELSPEYREDRTRSAEVHEAASNFIQREFERRLTAAPVGGKVVFMAGGGGAGKSSADGLLENVLGNAHTVYDGTLSSYDKAERNIKMALDAGQQVNIIYVYREPEEALRNGVLTRAMRTGRTVPIDALVKGHAGSSEAVRKLQEKFGDNPLFAIHAVDNSRGPGRATITDLSNITPVIKSGLKERFENAARQEYEAGRISESVYRATAQGRADAGAAGESKARDGGDRSQAARVLQERSGSERAGNPVTKDEAVVDGVRYSTRKRDLVDIPTIELKDLVGKKVVGIKADLTDAGRSYTGIDGSQLEFPVEMMGGPNYVRLPDNAKANVVWAVRGGGTLTKVMTQVNKADYVLVHAMNGNSHLTNSTISTAYLQTVEAYLRDGRISKENLKALDEIVRSTKNKSSLPDFPGFESPEIYSYIDGLSFDQRGALAQILEKKEAQVHGLPNLERFRRETIDPEFAGYRQGDAMLVIKVDKENPTVKLGEEGTKLHPSYPLGLRGKVIGKLAKGVNYEIIFRDYFKFAVPNFKNKEAGAWYAFDRKMPIQKITQDIANSVAPGSFKAITTARQAEAALNFANGNWLVSGKTKAQGGISVQEFVDALRANDGAAALTLYSAEDVKAGIKDKSFTIYQLGKEGGDKGLQVFFGLKRGTPWYKDMIDGVGDNEVEVVSVTNNEAGAPGIAIPAIITKAISEGATVLDAFAVKSARFPNGFLPEMYAQFGFEEIGRIPFDPSYYDANGLADLKAFWARGGWKEADGYPDVVVMRWKGNDEDRATAVERYVRSGATSVPGQRLEYSRAAAAESRGSSNRPRGQKRGGRGADGAAPRGDQGAGDAASVVSRAFGSIQELASLGDGDIRNLGLDPAEVQRLRDGLAVRRSARLAELARGPGARADAANDGQNVTGIHYGKAAGLSVLSGRSFGTGIKGAEQARLNEPGVDPRIKKRVYFYLTNNNADMPRPEIGLGSHVYRATLGNMYDPSKASAQAAKRVKDLMQGSGPNAFESAVLDAGYRGYLNREQGTAVVLNADVPVAYEGLAQASKMRDRVIQRAVAAVQTRTEGDELVRKPTSDEMVGIIKARPALAEAASSFKLQFGEARVKQSEAEAADRVLAESGSSFQFGGVMRSNRVTDTPAFKRWFGDSKVVDENGDPLVVYHGTQADFSEFDAERQGESVSGRGGDIGYFFANDPEVASDHALADWGRDEPMPNVMPVYLSMQNPEVIDNIGQPSRWYDDYGRKASLDAMAAGKDGLIIGSDIKVYVVFKNTQIKSATGNNGEFDATNPDIRKSNRARDSWFIGRDELGRPTMGAGAKAYRVAADLANNVLDRVGMKPISSDLGRAMRKMKMEIEQARQLTADAADSLSKLSEDERAMISDVIEGELKRGVKPPQRVLEVAASMQGIMSEQTAELVRLGMLSEDAAGRWDGKYLPRFYESKLMDEGKRWVKAAKSLLGRPRTMQGIKGSSLKGRGIFQTVPVEELEQWLAEGWQERDPKFDPSTDTEITVWRDYSRDERENMGEIRDAMFRFVMGYTKSQQDIALGRLYEQLANTVASKSEQEGYVQVPSTNVEDTRARRYGKLAGKWVPQEVMDHLSATDNSMQSDVMKFYLKALSMWKEGKTVLNPVSHANNVLSNLTAAHFAGVSYWDVQKYVGATRDLVKNNSMVQEARNAGLFGGTMTQAELVNMLPDQLKVLAAKTESKGAQAVDGVWNAMSFWLRKPLGKAYEAEDLFFRYLIYRDARNQGLSPDDSVDYAQKFIFNYDDLPKGARMVRNFALPFFSYTYKAVPMLAQTALEKPWRYAAPAAAIYTLNAIMYAFAAGAGDDEDDWMSIIKRYIMDPEFRAKARGMEEDERKNLPSWMKGYSLTLGTSKAVRLGVDEATDLPVFLDVSRMFPGGDLFDAQNNAGGVPLLAPITPNNPLLTAASALLFNKDSFTGKEVVKKTDTSAEAAGKRAEWAYKQIAPAIAVGNYHFDRAMNVLANVTGEPVNLGFKEYTGVNRDGTPVQPGYAAMQTVGIKARPIDLDMSAKIDQSQTNAMVRDIDAQIRSLRRLANKGAISDAAMEKETEVLKEKRQRLKGGLTVDGEEK